MKKINDIEYLAELQRQETVREKRLILYNSNIFMYIFTAFACLVFSVLLLAVAYSIVDPLLYMVTIIMAIISGSGYIYYMYEADKFGNKRQKLKYGEVL